MALNYPGGTEHLNKVSSNAWESWAESSILMYPGVRQVLTPMRKGAAGVAQLNARLQALLNPPAPGARSCRSALATALSCVLAIGSFR